MTCEGARFDALRNAFYNSSRKTFYDFWNRFLSFVIIVAGAAAVSDLGAQIGSVRPTVFAAIATTAAALQLVFDFGGKAAKHDYLQRRYYELIAEIVSNPGKERAAQWEASLHRLYADESPPMRALDAVSYNAACDALAYGEAHRTKVSFWQNIFRHWYSYPDSDFSPASAKNASPSA